MDKDPGTQCAHLSHPPGCPGQPRHHLSGAQDTQPPRWPTTTAQRQGKAASTMVLTLQGTLSITRLGPSTLTLCNRACKLSEYISFGPETQCANCLKFRHPKQRCKAVAACAICARPHPTESHSCEHPNCKDFPKRKHPATLRCVNCQGAHRATDRGCSSKRAAADLIMIE